MAQFKPKGLGQIGDSFFADAYFLSIAICQLSTLHGALKR